MAEGGTERSMQETYSLSGDSSLCSRHSLNYVQSVSVEICTIMKSLGYGEEIRRFRVRKYREGDLLDNTRLDGYVTLITAGSKAEGLTCAFESDRDVLHVLNNVLCLETGINLRTIPDDIEVYQMDQMDTRVYPGHCRLSLERKPSSCFSIPRNALCDNGKGDVLLSSSLFVDEFLKLPLINPLCQVGLEQHQRAGPSIPISFNGEFYTDRVPSLNCLCPSILQRWAARPRHWPPHVIVQKVVSLGAYVTPTGFQGSEYMHMEWRICFNTGETELVNNLNDTHAKVYVMLKMILKDCLGPCKKEITSYVMKNIVLWQAERYPQKQFDERSLLYWLHDGLRELKTAIATQQLSYYMIPKRNLMEASGLQDKQQRKWIADITDMIAEGPRVILRLPKIRQAVIASPEPMLWFSKKRMELEMLYLEWRNREVQCRDENGVVDWSDAMMQEIWRLQEEILIEMVERMRIESCAVQKDIYFRILM